MEELQAAGGQSTMLGIKSQSWAPFSAGTKHSRSRRRRKKQQPPKSCDPERSEQMPSGVIDRLASVSQVRRPSGLLAVCGLLLLAVFAVFSQTASHDFVNLDDAAYVHENRHVSKGLTAEGTAWAITACHAGNWHPLSWLSHMLDCQLYHLKPGGHHPTNVLLHAAAAVLLFLALRRMTGAVWPSAWVAAVFAIHLPRENALPGRVDSPLSSSQGSTAGLGSGCSSQRAVGDFHGRLRGKAEMPFPALRVALVRWELVPVIGLVQVGDQAMADRYTYLTQIGLYMAFAWGADVVGLVLSSLAVGSHLDASGGSLDGMRLATGGDSAKARPCGPTHWPVPRKTRSPITTSEPCWPASAGSTRQSTITGRP